jgi:hypothetical protein
VPVVRLQLGVAPVHFEVLVAEHWVHEPASGADDGWQAGRALFDERVHSVSLVQARQWNDAVSQTGVRPSRLVVEPGTQSSPSWSVHCTQTWFLQLGAVTGQSALPPHSTQVPPAQIGVGGRQVALVWQVVWASTTGTWRQMTQAVTATRILTADSFGWQGVGAGQPVRAGTHAERRAERSCVPARPDDA